MDRNEPRRFWRPSALPPAGGSRGASILLICFAMLVLLACIGLAIDGFRLLNFKLRQENAAEVLALAALKGFKDSGNITDAVARANGSAGSDIKLDLSCSNSSKGCIQFGIWDGVSFTPGATPVDAARVTLGLDTGFAGTIFLGVLGFHDLRTASQGIAYYDPTRAIPPVTPRNNPFVIVREAGR